MILPNAWFYSVCFICCQVPGTRKEAVKCIVANNSRDFVGSGDASQ